MKKQLLKLPLYLFASGFMIRFVERVIVFILIKGTNEWTLEMGDKVFFVRVILSLIFYILIGIRLSKIYTRKECVISSSFVVVYSIISLTIEQAFQHWGTYSIISYYMYLPLEIFVTVTSIIGRISSADVLNWIYIIPSLFAPYLFVLFTKKNFVKHTIKRA